MASNFGYVIGVDYGTDSVRTILLDAATGEEIASSVYDYPRWKAGDYCDASINQFRQHPLDYVEGLEITIKDCLSKAGKEIADKVKGISVDTTGSTPIAVDATGTPLCMLDGLQNNPNAMFVLWKDHTAIREAAEINKHATQFEINYLQFVGGVYSSEWYWAKLLHILRADKEVANQIHSFVEHCDWIPYLLTGAKDVNTLKKGVCSAGHKGLWASSFGGYPPKEFFNSLDPVLKIVVENLNQSTYTADKPAGKLCDEWASRLGLSTEVIIGVGAFDAHMGAVGGQIEPYYLSKVMGTSTCDMLVAPIEEVGDKLVKGICGQVPGSVIPGMLGLEAGQSAFGDAYAWFKQVLLWPVKHVLSDPQIVLDSNTKKVVEDSISERLLTQLAAQASEIVVEENSEIAIDWMNGRRTPDANQSLKGAFAGLSLGSDAPKIFRALVEATCFGAKAIVERFQEQGIEVKGLIGLGGVAKKSPYIMQTMADVMDMPIKIHKSEQTCAIGAAMFAATASGIYKNVEEAMQAMGSGFDATYFPNGKVSPIYQKRYLKYKELGQFLENAAI